MDEPQQKKAQELMEKYTEEMQNMLRETNDFKEGVKAGFDRREPVFTGT